jgi:ComF family protein
MIPVTAARKRTPAKNRALSAKPFLSLARRVEDFFIPPLCVVCDKPLDDSGKWFCAGCAESLAVNRTTRNACPRCAVNSRKRECACEFAWDFPFEKIFSVYDYDDTLSSIARHIKYKGKSRLAFHMGIISAQSVPSDFWDGMDFVIPVPLHRARMRKRGYNQAEHFARGLLKGIEPENPARPEGKSPLSLRTDLLTRIRNTGTQTQLGRDGRLENLIGAFAANPCCLDDIKGKRVVLIDDILTTGATTEACTDELLKAGCAAVRVLSLGRD